MKNAPPLRHGRLGDILRVVVFIGDGLVLSVAQLLAFWLRLKTRIFDGILIESPFLRFGHEAVEMYATHFFLGTCLFLALGVSFGIYSKNAYLRPRFILGELLKVCALWVMGYLLVSFFFDIEPPVSRVFVALSGIFAYGALTVWRLSLNNLIRRVGLMSRLQERVLVVGWTKETAALWKRLVHNKSGETAIVGVISLEGSGFDVQPPLQVPIVGDACDLDSILGECNADTLLLTHVDLQDGRLEQIVDVAHHHLKRLMVIPAFFQVLFSGLRVESLRGVPVLTLGSLPLDRLSSRMAKRAVDIVGALLGLALSWPVMAICALFVRRESSGPALFYQERLGRQGRVFRMLKLRTMRPDASLHDHLNQSTTPNDPRLLRTGAFMRRWNIDELPQFWNVLKGEMSLVGPRPERPYHASCLGDEIRHYNVRMTVKPGMTGWAAVNGWRGNTDLNERIRFDLDYIERWSLLFDFYIMLLTFVRNKNAY